MGCGMEERIIYLDNSATTPLSVAARKKITETLDVFGNPSSLHAAGDKAANALRAARRSVLLTLGVRSRADEQDRELVFTSCGTEATSLALLGCAHAKKRREAKRIITTNSEHPSVENALRALADEGFEIVRLSTRGGVLDMTELEAALDKPIFMASLMLVNNETGALYDVKSAFEKIKRAYPDAITHCDAVQGYLKMKLTPATLGADLITLSAHKVHGPKGVGALYISSQILKERKISPFLVGGGQEHGMRSGTENLIGIAAFGAAAEDGYKKMAHTVPYLASLRALAEESITAADIGIKINAPVGARAPHILSISLPDIKSQTMLNFLSAKGIYVSSGSACSSHSNTASPTLLAFGLSEREADCTLRISFSEYNTKEDVEALVAALTDGIRTLVKIKR